MKGVLLFGHGARQADWAEPFHRLRAEMRARAPATPVELGFLELMRPGFDEAVELLLAAGADDIVVVPVFIAAGSHVRRDLPRMAAEALTRHPGLRVTLAPPVGEAPDVLAAMADYALAVRPETDA